MPDFKEIIEGIKEILQLVYGGQTPSWILSLLGYFLLFGLLLLGLLAFLTLLSKIKDIVSDKFWPLFYDREKRHRSKRRKRFAEYIENEVRTLNNKEEWSDYRFAELEAEVDAEGRRMLLGLIPDPRRFRNHIRRERSLSKALKSSRERLVVLEGEPGSGKSVALRHVALLMARQAIRSRSTKSIIPIYINLKGLERREGEAIDRNLISSIILKTLNRANDRDIEEFLDEEFSRGLKEGTWFFLFDSFDEIPEVLSSTEADKNISNYAGAISDFLQGLNQCRGVLASRFFHGPKQFGWPRFRVLALSDSRRLELIRKADLKPAIEKEFIGRLGIASPDITSMVGNPMFLSLLCTHMRDGQPFPENAHKVFESYINSRLIRDSERLNRQFGLSPSIIRALAETAAFCMAADNMLGLSPTRERLKSAANNLNMYLGENCDKILDALEYIKLARSEDDRLLGESRRFTFSHRRFQEYFATCVVLRDSTSVSSLQLLLDARWRETAVVLCQSQPAGALQPLIKEAETLLGKFVVETDSFQIRDRGLSTLDLSLTTYPKPSFGAFKWPTHAAHVLGLLQEGFGRRLDLLPDDMRRIAGNLINKVNRVGTLIDKKVALDLAGIIPANDLRDVLRDAFKGASKWLKRSAYQQVARLSEIPDDIAHDIRATLVTMTLNRRLYQEKLTTYAHISNLSKAQHFLSILRLLSWVPTIDFSLHLVLLICPYILFALGEPVISGLDDSSSNTALIRYSAAVTVMYLGFRNNLIPTLRLWLSDNLHNSSADYYAALANRILFTISASILLSGSLNVYHNLIMLYIGLWAPAALICAKSGQLTNLFWWPFFPIAIVIKLISKSKSILPKFSAEDIGWDGFLGILVTALLNLAPVWLGIYSLQLMAKYAYLLGPLAIIIVEVGAIIVGMIVVSIITYLTFVLGLDLTRWKWWSSTHGVSISSHEFLEELGKYRSGIFRYKFINYVRSKGLLTLTGESERLIYAFAIVLEKKYVGLKLYAGFYTDELNPSSHVQDSDIELIAFKRLCSEYFSNKSRLFHIWNSLQIFKLEVEILDEVYRLVDQLRAEHTPYLTMEQLKTQAV
jgi:hypothetical protein